MASTWVNGQDLKAGRRASVNCTRSFASVEIKEGMHKSNLGLRNSLANHPPSF